MSEIVFILGAGASKHAGAPLMADFLGKATEIRRAGKAGKFESDFDCVFDSIAKLQSVGSKWKLTLDNIESVFAIFEMGKLVNRFPGISSRKEVRSLSKCIKLLILKTLEQTIQFPLLQGAKYPWGPPDAYHLFAKLIKDLNNNGRQNRCSIITFNYDIALDYALYFNAHLLDYCLLEDRNPDYTSLMKLHGSLNWSRCSACNQIISQDWGNFFQKYNDDLKRMGERQLKYFSPANPSTSLPLKFPLTGLKHCDKNVPFVPFIVPPTWNKTKYYKSLSKVWSRAALELSEAKNIFISGYSLPESDSFWFRYLFALSSMGANSIERFWVFDPGEKNQVCPRFKELLGDDTKTKFQFFPLKFEDAIGVISREL